MEKFSHGEVTLGSIVNKINELVDNAIFTQDRIDSCYRFCNDLTKSLNDLRETSFGEAYRNWVKININDQLKKELDDWKKGAELAWASEEAIKSDKKMWQRECELVEKERDELKKVLETNILYNIEKSIDILKNPSKEILKKRDELDFLYHETKKAQYLILAGENERLVSEKNELKKKLENIRNEYDRLTKVLNARTSENMFFEGKLNKIEDLIRGKQ